MNFLGYNNCLPNMERSHLKLKRKESSLHGELNKGSWAFYNCFIMYIFEFGKSLRNDLQNQEF